MKKQCGFTELWLLPVVFLLMLAAAMTAGCTSLQQAGNTAYTVKPFTVTGKDGSVALVCCELLATDGKEYATREIGFQTNGSGFQLKVIEGDSKAFKGQAIAAKAATVLPVTNLSDILK